MVEYTDKKQLIETIETSADQYIKEFDSIDEADKNVRMAGEERTPYENLAYQLGWMGLIQEWERLELAGRVPEMPAPGIKWNKLGELHKVFYSSYSSCSIQELKRLFTERVKDLCIWLEAFDDEALFRPGGRKWSQSTNSNWSVWKWVHINTVAPFKTFRSKIRKWKRLRSAQ